MMKLVFLLIIIVSLAGRCSAVETIKGLIGDTDLTYQARVIAPKGTTHLMLAGKAKLWRIREVYPDAPKQPRYIYDLTIGGHFIYRRDHLGTGFGPVSYFVSLPKWAEKSKALRLTNKGQTPVRLLDIRPVEEKKLAALEKQDSFGLLGLVPAYKGWDEARKWLEEIVTKMPVKDGFYRGYAAEIPYANHPIQKVAEAIDKEVEWAKHYDLAFLPFLVSWWGGTPGRVDDGEGGNFGDVKYQQICWSPEDNTDEGPELHDLLGDRWNIHYGLSVPNQWSNCPWLTMNSPKLNAYRKKRLGEAIMLLTDRMGKWAPRVEGVCLENEPRYWDTACEAGNGKSKRKTVWADFNPLTVADAAKDGVDLDPSDGLDRSERLWLVRNVARYNQNTVDWTLEGLKKSGLSSIPPVYTHSLQIVGFPGDEICHPMSEFAYAKGARTGLEGLWTKLSDFDRIREWGPWANVNREENDGQDIKYHLWDLRVTYARGAKFYNSYNWHAIGSQRFFDYVQEFLNDLPTVQVKNPDIKIDGARKLSFVTDPDVQGANRVKLRLSFASSLPSSLLLTVRNSTGSIIGFARTEGPFGKGNREVEFVFSEPFELPRGERGTLNLEAENDKLNDKVKLCSARFEFDLRRERNQSLACVEQNTKGR